MLTPLNYIFKDLEDPRTASDMCPYFEAPSEIRVRASLGQLAPRLRPRVDRSLVGKNYARVVHS